MPIAIFAFLFLYSSFAIEKLNQELSGIDILINSAGQIHSEPLINIMGKGDKKHDPENWDRIIRNDLNSVFYVIATVVEKMVAARRKGVIINISSICAQGNVGQCAYSSAKAGVNSFTKVIAKELGAFGIRAVAIAPGFIDTESTKTALSESVLEGWIKKTPLRKLGTTDSIVETVKYILTCDHLTGCVIDVDGGLTL